LGLNKRKMERQNDVAPVVTLIRALSQIFCQEKASIDVIVRRK